MASVWYLTVPSLLRVNLVWKVQVQIVRQREDDAEALLTPLRRRVAAAPEQSVPEVHAGLADAVLVFGEIGCGGCVSETVLPRLQRER